MYRLSLEMDQSKEQQQLVFLRRVTGYPLVNRVVVYTTDVYAKAKDYNGLLRFTLDTAEKTVLVVADTARPVISKFETPITIVDSLACKTLDIVEHKIPLVKKTPEEITDETKKYYNATIIEPALVRYNNAKAYGFEKVNAFKDYGYKTAVVLTDNKYGQLLTVTLDHMLLKADSLVDNYIPHPKLEGQPEEPKMQDDGSPVNKALVLSKKFRQRVGYHALIQLRAAKKRTDEILSNLHITVDLLQYAKTGMNTTNQVLKETLANAQQKILQLWKDFNKDADAAGAKTIEQKLLFVAAKLTNQLDATYKKVSASLALLPSRIRPNLKLVQDYITDLYTQISKANSWQDISEVVISQWHAAISTLKVLTSQYFDSFLSSRYVSWLVKVDNEGKVTENGLLATSNALNAEQVANDSSAPLPPSPESEQDTDSDIRVNNTDHINNPEKQAKKRTPPNHDLSD